MDRSHVTRYLDILHGCFLFRAMDKEALRAALAEDTCVIESYPAGAAIFTPDDFRTSLGIIVKGKAAVSKTAGDHRVALNILEQGQMFGAITLFAQSDRFAADVTAMGPCRVVFLERALLYSMMQQDFSLCERYLQYLTQRIYFLNRKIDAFTGGSAAERLATFLLDSAEGGTVLLPKLTALAEMLNISRASLYRALDALQEAGGICRTRATVTILSETILQTIR